MKKWYMLRISTPKKVNDVEVLVSCSTANYEGFVFSKAEYKKVSDDSPLFAVDCEMVSLKSF